MSRKDELKGVGKILDILWENSYYSMGKQGVERIEKELIYYFGKNWSTDMYKLIEDGDKPRTIKALKTFKELKKNANTIKTNK